jgi:chromosome segregation ATPase
MSTPTIDFNEIADGMTAILNERAQRAQTAQEQAERDATLRGQREADAARAAQIANIRGEFTRLCDRERYLKSEIDTKRLSLEALQRELPALGAQHNVLLAERARLLQSYPFLKG